jgi:GNAT superfamily N-acetyltransferase
MHVFTATLDRILLNQHLRARLLAATPKPYTVGRVTYSTDLYNFLADGRVHTQEVAPVFYDYDAIVVAERGAVLGWGFLWPAEPGSLSGKLGRILSLAVAPEHQRRGVGARIAQAARKIAGDVPIYGTPVNAAAEAFFRRHDMLSPDDPRRARPRVPEGR